MTGWQELAAVLARRLSEAGFLAEGWREAFEQTPRHVFVPGQPLQTAYADQAIVIQQRPAETVGGGNVMLPTSSASAPSAVAAMLGQLDLRGGQRVLEIGTGTGYHTALLCHRLGDHHVASVDIDPQLVVAARAALASLGYHPSLVAGDGHAGLPPHAPYDAIVATCSIRHLPPAWISQLRPDGQLVAPLHGSEYTLVVLTKTAPDEVTGHLADGPASFMPLRTDAGNPLATPQVLAQATTAMPHHGTTTTDPAMLVDPCRDLTLFLHLHLPGIQLGTGDDPALGKTVTIATPDAIALAGLTPTRTGTWPVLQRGRRLWDTIEHATRRWEQLGHPGRERYGITARDRIDRQYVWLDAPDGPYSWPMPL